MEEWVLLFDLLYSYLKQCHETWKVLQKLKGRPNYLESAHQFVEIVAPVRGLLVAVGRCNTQVRLSLTYVSGNLLDLRYLGSL